MKKIILTLILAVIFSNISTFANMFAVVSIGGTALDVTNNQPISVYIEIYDATGKRLQKIKSNTKDGYYFITGLKSGETYELRCAEFEYMKQITYVSTPASDKYQEISKDLIFTPKKVGTQIPVNVKIFEYSKSLLKNGIDIFFKQSIECLKLNPTVRIKIVSYPDNDNNPTINAQLTLERSNAIRNYLIQNGLEQDRVVAEGASKVDPKNPVPVGKATKGKRYVGKSYFFIEAY